MADRNWEMDIEAEYRVAYSNVDQLFQKVHDTCNGVYYEVIVDPIEPETGPQMIYSIHIMNVRNCFITCGGQNIHGINQSLRNRLRRIEQLQENFTSLVQRSLETYRKVKEKYDGRNYKITFLRKKEGNPDEKVELFTHPENQDKTDTDDEDGTDADDEFESDDEDMDSEDEEIDFEDDIMEIDDDGSELDWESESESDLGWDSGLNSETDTQTEWEIDYVIESDSGID